MLNMFMQFMRNPNQFNMTQDMLKDPNKTIQNLLNSGRITQDQYNQAVQKAQMLQNNPQFRQFFANNTNI